MGAGGIVGVTELTLEAAQRKTHKTSTDNLLVTVVGDDP
jgi:hypothetical protein